MFLRVTKLLEFEFELGIECFQNIIDSRCYKRTLSKKYYLKVGKTKTALDEEEISAAIIKTFQTRYHFDRQTRWLCKKNELVGHFPLAKSSKFATKNVYQSR